MKKVLIVLLIALVFTTTACSKTDSKTKQATKEQGTKKEVKEEVKKEEKIDLTGTFFAKADDTSISYERYIIFNSDNTLSLQQVTCGTVAKFTGSYTTDKNNLEIKLDDGDDTYNFKIENNNTLIPENESKNICGSCDKEFNEFVKGEESEKQEINTYSNVEHSPDESMW